MQRSFWKRSARVRSGGRREGISDGIDTHPGNRLPRREDSSRCMASELAVWPTSFWGGSRTARTSACGRPLKGQSRGSSGPPIMHCGSPSPRPRVIPAEGGIQVHRSTLTLARMGSRQRRERRKRRICATKWRFRRQTRCYSQILAILFLP